MVRRTNLAVVILALCGVLALSGPAWATDGNDPISHWMLDEGTGLTAYDSVGSNHGILVNGPIWTTGQIDGALSFDGIDDYVDLGNDTSLKPPLPVTLSAWINLSQNDKTIISLDNCSSTYYGVWMNVNLANQLTIGFGDGSGWGSGSYRRSKEGTTPLNAGTWYHVVAVVGGATDMSLYVNGIDDGGTYSGTGGTLVYSSGNASIGTKHYEGICFDGMIDDMRLYNRALSAEEVQALYLRGGPVSHWTFDEGAGTTAYDSAGSNHGTLVNGPVWTGGQIDGALCFDGADDYVDLGNDSSLKPPLPVALSAWINLSRNDAVVICLDESSSIYYGVTLLVDISSHATIGFGDGNGWGSSAYRRSKTGTTTLDTDTWYHVAGVVRGATNMDVYINGVDDGGTYSGTGGSLAYSSANASIGTSHYEDICFDGKIDDVRLYDRALSAEEVEGLYEGGMCGVLAGKSIKRALERKIASLEELQAALGEEAAALEALNDLLASGELGDLSRRDVLRAKWKIRSAMWRERLCRAGLRRTIGKLEDALALLGCEVEPQSWPEPHTEVDDAIIRADINQDGVVNFEDIAILTEYWLKSYQVE